jgi:hypothetical protein
MTKSYFVKAININIIVPGFYPGTPGTKNKTDRRDISEILLKVLLNAIAITL